MTAATRFLFSMLPLTRGAFALGIELASNPKLIVASPRFRQRFFAAGNMG